MVIVHFNERRIKNSEQTIEELCVELDNQRISLDANGKKISREKID